MAPRHEMRVVRANWYRQRATEMPYFCWPLNRSAPITYSQGFSWSSARYTIDVEFILGHLYTTSYCSRALLGDRVGEFEEDMALELQRLRVDGASGTFVWSPGVSYIFARKRV